MIKTDYDVVVIGGGPAGLTSAIYALRAGKSTCVIEQDLLGGQMVVTAEIKNFPGEDNLNGIEWGQRTQKQIQALGGVFKYGEVTKIDYDKKVVYCNDTKIKCSSIIICTGAHARTLNAMGEAQFMGKGVSYCAVCDGTLYTDKDVIVVGGGNSATEDALYLANFCSSVTLLVRSGAMRAESNLQQQVLSNPKITVLYNHAILKINGDTKVTDVDINTQNGIINKKVGGVFISIGRDPNSDIIGNSINNENGYIITDDNMQTNIEGVFAAGDIRKKFLRQIVTACSDGAIAGVSAARYINNLN